MRINLTHTGLLPIFSLVILSFFTVIPLSFADYVDSKATSDGSVMVAARWGIVTDGHLTIPVEFRGSQSKVLEHVNYVIMASQNGNVILIEQVHANYGQTEHVTSTFSPGVPVELEL